MCSHSQTVDFSGGSLLQDYYDGFGAGQKRRLARQAFLRSYHFCVEETFKDKLTRYSLRLKDESFEELVKDSLRKLVAAAKDNESLRKFVRAAKGFKDRHYETFKDKLAGYSLWLKDKSFEEIVNESLRKLMRAAKGFNGRKEFVRKLVRAAKGFQGRQCHYENLCEKITEEDEGIDVMACDVFAASLQT